MVFADGWNATERRDANKAKQSFKFTAGDEANLVRIWKFETSSSRDILSFSLTPTYY
jgi:hypothetical protein